MNLFYSVAKVKNQTATRNVIINNEASSLANKWACFIHYCFIIHYWIKHFGNSFSSHSKQTIKEEICVIVHNLLPSSRQNLLLADLNEKMCVAVQFPMQVEKGIQCSLCCQRLPCGRDTSTPGTQQMLRGEGPRWREHEQMAPSACGPRSPWTELRGPEFSLCLLPGLQSSAREVFPARWAGLAGWTAELVAKNWIRSPGLVEYNFLNLLFPRDHDKKWQTQHAAIGEECKPYGKTHWWHESFAETGTRSP